MVVVATHFAGPFEGGAFVVELRSGVPLGREAGVVDMWQLLRPMRLEN